ncbi:MAG: DMT family transporter [Pseudomonadota bacterium]
MQPAAPTQTTRQRNAAGIVAMLLAMACYVTNDTFVKVVSDDLPVGQIIFIRGVFGSVLVFGFLAWRGLLRDFAPLKHWSVSARVVTEMLATVLFLSALVRMPIANAMAILQGVPFMVTILAVIILKETVGWRRWSAILVGFMGMLMVVQPGLEGFQSAAWLAVAAMVTMSLRDIVTTYLPENVGSLMVTAITMATLMVLGAASSLFGNWEPPDAMNLFCLFCASVFLIGGHFFMTEATRNAEMSAIAPFRYSILFWAFLYGWLIWGDLPNLLAVSGILVIVGSGLYVWQREQRVREKDGVA